MLKLRSDKLWLAAAFCRCPKRNLGDLGSVSWVDDVLVIFMLELSLGRPF